MLIITSRHLPMSNRVIPRKKKYFLRTRFCIFLFTLYFTKFVRKNRITNAKTPYLYERPRICTKVNRGMRGTLNF